MEAARANVGAAPRRGSSITFGKAMFTYFEFHDSVLAALKGEGGRCILELRPAYVHQSDGRPGIDAGEGFWQDIEIVISGAAIKKPALSLPCPINDGHLTVGEIRMSNLAPTTLREAKKVSLKIWMMVGGAEIEIEGTSIEVRTMGEAEFAESFPGTSA
jgi:hypothetical protein